MGEASHSHPHVKPKFSLAVYCGSRTGAAPIYLQTAIAVGRWIGENGGQLVYGGGRNGLMGAMATAALEAGAPVIGVIPRALEEREHANFDCTQLHVVDTMPQRKMLMAQHASAFLALCGGIGTFEEIIEMWVQRDLGFHNKPLGLLNTLGYYDGFLQFVQHAVQQGFMEHRQLSMPLVHGSIDQLLPRLCLAQQ